MSRTQFFPSSLCCISNFSLVVSFVVDHSSRAEFPLSVFLAEKTVSVTGNVDVALPKVLAVLVLVVKAAADVIIEPVLLIVPGIRSS